MNDYMYTVLIDGHQAGIKFSCLDDACDYAYNKKKEAKEKVCVKNCEGRIIVQYVV